jgi:hypothetical protein
MFVFPTCLGMRSVDPLADSGVQHPGAKETEGNFIGLDLSPCYGLSSMARDKGKSGERMRPPLPSAKRKSLIAALSIFAAMTISPAVSILAGWVQTYVPPPDSQTQEDQQRLAAILRKSKNYCQRLEKAALDFVCQEEVSERYDKTRELAEELIFTSPTGGFVGTEPIRLASKTKKRSTYLYDYQFIRKNQRATEKKKLIEINGKKNTRDAWAEPTQFQYGNILFGPVGLLSESWQPYHDYEIIGDDIINGQKLVLIRATPRPSLNRPHAYGRIWINEDDGSVFRIAWDQKSLGNFQIIEDRAKRLEAEPQVTSLTEYEFEKNGLRFPSRDSTEEAYVKKNGKKFVRAETIVIYKNYKFFTVETEITY